MIYPYGKDYIQYLNNEGYSRITFEQWKNKIAREGSVKGIQRGIKNAAQHSPKYK